MFNYSFSYVLYIYIYLCSRMGELIEVPPYLRETVFVQSGQEGQFRLYDSCVYIYYICVTMFRVSNLSRTIYHVLVCIIIQVPCTQQCCFKYCSDAVARFLERRYAPIYMYIRI